MCFADSFVLAKGALSCTSSLRPLFSASPQVMVFVASDTVLGLHLAHAALGGTTVLSVSGSAVHSTRTLHAATPDGVKVIADLLAMAVSDVLLAVGQSSFSGAAGALHGGITRVGDRASSFHIEPAEMAMLKASFAVGGR